MRYPIGIETFSEIREKGYVYVDKTSLVHKLVDECKYVFLGRPRRFGKSLLLSTLRAYFEGRRDLFEGLAIAGHETEWRRHPVFHFNLARYNSSIASSLETIIGGYLNEWERLYGRRDETEDLSQRFHNVIISAYEATGEQVVVLVDEYDAPLVENLENEKTYAYMRDLLKSLYVNLKVCDPYIRFAMMTGVSRFSKMTVFSGLNNLQDITLRDEYSEICGITEQELESYFSEGVRGIAGAMGVDYGGALAELKANYDGYHFTKTCKDIYNPFSLLNAFSSREIESYWFISGTPTFLIRQIRKGDKSLPSMFTEKINRTQLAQTDTHSTSAVAMMFQTGYLTIKGYDRRREQYILGIPNREVRLGLFTELAAVYTERPREEAYNKLLDIRILLEDGDVDSAMEHIRSYLAGIPYNLSDGKPEIYFENNLYILFNLIGIDARTEWLTSDGRIDMLLKMRDHIYVIELKLDGTADEALAQINRKDYALQFRTDGRPIIKIGVNFSKDTRNIDTWIIEKES